MINKQRSANQSTISNSFNDPKYSTSADNLQLSLREALKTLREEQEHLL